MGVAAAAAEPLSEEELAAWQEKLSDPAYNGFVSAMYSDASRLPVSQVFYNGAGVDHEMTEEERAAVLEAMGGDPDCAIYAVTTQAADGFLPGAHWAGPGRHRRGLWQRVALPPGV